MFGVLPSGFVGAAHFQVPVGLMVGSPAQVVKPVAAKRPANAGMINFFTCSIFVPHVSNLMRSVCGPYQIVVDAGLLFCLRIFLGYLVILTASTLRLGPIFNYGVNTPL